VPAPWPRHPPPRQLGQLIGGTAPGTNVMRFPEGTALRLRAGTVLTFQMHYTAHGHEMKDRTQIGFRFAPGMPDEEMRTYYFFATPLEVPGGAKLVSTAWYDNSASNRSNPDPKIDVLWGDQTWEEMQYTAFLYTVPSRKLRP
jgi:hypothetical protein